MKTIIWVILMIILSVTLFAQQDSCRNQPDSGVSELFMFNENDEDGIQTTLKPSSQGHNTTFYEASRMSLSATGFQYRGYSAGRLEVYGNGLLMHDVKTSAPVTTGGLAGVFRSELHPGLELGGYGNGGLAGSAYTDYAAAAQQQRGLLEYTLGNRLYQHSITAAYHTGMMRSGWALSLAMVGARSEEGYMQGTSADQYSWFAGLSRRLSVNSTIHFFTLGGKSALERSSPAIQEAYDLAGTTAYNPSWGYQDGIKRNSNVVRYLRSLYALQYQHRADRNTTWDLSFSYRQGYQESSGLDWYNAPDPRPDYYQKLPSYYVNDPATRDPEQAYRIRQLWINNEATRQINWDNLYDVNRMNVEVVNGLEGKRSAYVLGADREEQSRLDGAASLQKVVSDHVKCNTGLVVALQHGENYRKMLDLLGGDYYVNINPFTTQGFATSNAMKQVDLNHPDGIVRVGDKYGHDYRSRFVKGFLYTSILISFDKFRFFVHARSDYDGYDREGLYRNGLFPDSSYGRSAWQQFLTYQVGAGVAYKAGDKQRIRLNAVIMRAAPSMDDIFIAPKARNSVIPLPATEKITSAEVHYDVQSHKVQCSLAAFATDIRDGTRIRRFYYEDYNAFVNYVMQHIGIRHLGAELLLQLRIGRNLTVTTVACWMQVFYQFNPSGSLYRDGDTTKAVMQHTVYLKNYNVSSGPQSALATSFQYTPGKQFRAGLRFSLSSRQYVDINPLRHTEEAISGVTPGTAQYEAVLRQEQLTSVFLVDLSVGKTFALYKIWKHMSSRARLDINAHVGNLFNRKDYRASGYNQLRYDYQEGNPDLFPAKYTYMMGLQYSIRCRLQF